MPGSATPAEQRASVGIDAAAILVALEDLAERASPIELG
jgi:hypothetical protein